MKFYKTNILSPDDQTEVADIPSIITEASDIDAAYCFAVDHLGNFYYAYGVHIGGFTNTIRVYKNSDASALIDITLTNHYYAYPVCIALNRDATEVYLYVRATNEGENKRKIAIVKLDSDLNIIGKIVGASDDNGYYESSKNIVIDKENYLWVKSNSHFWRIDTKLTGWIGGDFATIKDASVNPVLDPRNGGATGNVILVVDNECNCWSVYGKGSNFETNYIGVVQPENDLSLSYYYSNVHSVGYAVDGCTDKNGGIHFLSNNGTNCLLYKIAPVVPTNPSDSVIVDTKVIEDDVFSIYGSSDGYLHYVQCGIGEKNIRRIAVVNTTSEYGASSLLNPGIGWKAIASDPNAFKLSKYGPTGVSLS